MPADPSSPSVIFANALLGQQPTSDQLASLEPIWLQAVQATQRATPQSRQAVLTLARGRQTSLEGLISVLLGEPPSPPITIPGASASPGPADPWPDPLPLDRRPLPPFPHHTLPSWLGNYIRAEASATQTPPELAGLLALAVLATALAGSIRVNPWGDWIEPINLFTIVVLPPGHRKSAVFADVTQPLQEYQAEITAQAAPQLAQARRQYDSARRALARAQLTADHAPDDARPALLAQAERRAETLASLQLPVLPRMVTDDCTPERLATLLHQQAGRLALLSPEGGIFDILAGRYTSAGRAPNLDHILKGHAGDPIIVDRVDRPPEIIPRPALTIGLTVQPETLRHLYHRPGFHGRGLLARFLYAVPNVALGARDVDAEPVPASLRDDYRRRIHTLLTAFSPRTTAPGTQNPALPFTHEAAERLRDYARDIEPRLAPTGDLDPIVDWASKLVGAVARLSALIHLAAIVPQLPLPLGEGWGEGALPPPETISDGKLPLPLGEGWGEDHDRADSKLPLPPVSTHAVDAAIALAHYLTEHARAAYAAMGADPSAATLPLLLTWLRRSRLTTFTRRDANRAIGYHFRAAADLDTALDQLEHHRYIRPRPLPVRSGAGRRPGPTYDVHPSLTSPTG